MLYNLLLLKKVARIVLVIVSYLLLLLTMQCIVVSVVLTINLTASLLPLPTLTGRLRRSLTLEVVSLLSLSLCTVW